MPLSSRLIELAKIFSGRGHRLYLVGGSVRDALLGRHSYDLDVCSDLPPADIIALLGKTEFTVPQSNLPLGTLIIVCGDFKCEYTCFRTESYRKGGGHTPERVRYPASLKDDALRRDFTINALYYDLQASRLTDPLQTGLSDLASRIVRTTRDPREVFSEDPLRIMRLCRIAASLGFRVDGDTLNAAVELSGMVGALTRHRIGDELQKMLEGGGAGLNLLYQTGAADIVSPCIAKDSCAIAESAGLPLPAALAVLFTGCGARIANQTMKELAVPAAVADLATFLIENKDYDNKDGDSLKLAIAQMGREKARCLSCYLKAIGSGFAEKFAAALGGLLESGAPMSLGELALTGSDLIQSLGIKPGPQLGRMLTRAFGYAVLNPEKNTADALMQYLSNGLEE